MKLPTIAFPARRRPLPAFGLLLAAVLAAALPAAARERPAQDPVPVTEGVVRTVIDGDTVRLANGTEVRLVGIQAPKLPLGRPGFPTWPLAPEAKAALEALTLGKRLSLSYGGRRIDRHGRLLAHLHDPSGIWIQGEMLRRGLARVYTFADNRSRAAELYAAEREARAHLRGIWAHPFYRVRTVDETQNLIGSFQIVEGRILSVAVVRGRAYLNFGRDWRTDFTVTISPRDLRRFSGGRLAVEALRGKRVRVRGWINKRNGPMIEATHPEQIERLP